MNIEKDWIVSGEVKWYDNVRGYGFLIPEGGGRDVLISAESLRAFGRSALAKGARATLLATVGARGPHAQEILRLEEPALTEADDVGQENLRPTDVLRTQAADGPLRPARVKWFDKPKGFGFVNIFGCQDDVFVHIDTLQKCGFSNLEGGQALSVRTVNGPRGLLVSEVRIWEAGYVTPSRV